VTYVDEAGGEFGEIRCEHITARTGNEKMNTTKLLAASVIAACLMYGTQSAQAHCDSVDGPVAQAALTALETGNPNRVLPYAPAVAEAEIKAAFARSAKVRALGPDAKALADRAFMETAVRLHRAGEGAAYTGLKPAGSDFGPAIPAAEQAIDSGDASQVKVLLEGAMNHDVAGPSFVEETVTLTGKGRRPHSPVHVAGRRPECTEDIALRWIRRTGRYKKNARHAPSPKPNSRHSGPDRSTRSTRSPIGAT
jgi:hypothetical protein